MTDFTVTAPTADEAEELRTENPTSTHSYPAPRDGYVRGTQVAKALNELLVQAGHSDRQVKSQMVYNYINKGYLGGGKGSENYPHITVAEATKFVRLQFARRTNVPTTTVEADENIDGNEASEIEA